MIGGAYRCVFFGSFDVTRSQHGSRESSWAAARRCLAILRRLQQGPAKKADLIAAVLDAEGAAAYGDAGTSHRDVAKRFDNDKLRLLNQLRMPIRYDGSAGGYVLGELERPLLNLSDTHIETLALLANFFGEESPNGLQVQQLIDQLVAWLPEERARMFRSQAIQQPSVELRQRDSEEIAPDVWEIVLEGYQSRREIEYDYLSSSQADGIPRQHHVQPWDLYFSDRGHWRLRGFCLFNDGPNGPWHPNRYSQYRVSRIVRGSARLLPTRLPPVRPRGRTYTVLFELSPVIARFGISRRKELIDEPVISELDEGWVRVEGQTTDVFELARNLLYYGANCRVLGGPELYNEVRSLVKGLGGIYW